LPAGNVLRSYAPVGMTSRCQAAGGGAVPATYHPPHWVRARIVDEAGTRELPAGTRGRLALFDLAGSGTALHWLTADQAVARADGFQLLGRCEPS
jgi:hypothetical protein